MKPYQFKGTLSKVYATEYAGTLFIQDEPFYGALNLFDYDIIGKEQAEANANAAVAGILLAQKYDPSTWEQKLSQFEKMEKALQKISKSHNALNQ